MKLVHKKFSEFVTTIFNMLKMVWNVHPLYFSSQFFIEVLQGLIPLATAWITKTLFDLLGQNIQGSHSPYLPRILFLLFGSYAILSIVNQMIASLENYLSSDLGRRLSISVQSSIYQKVSSLKGIAPFENPHFHNTIQLAAQGAQSGPEQILYIFTALTANLVTLIGFIGLLINNNLFLAGLVIATSLPQFYAAITLSKQRLDLAFQNTPNARKAGYYSYLLTNTIFAKELRLFNLGPYFLQKFHDTFMKIHQAQRDQQKTELRWQTVISLITNGVTAGVFIVVVLQAFAGRLSIGDVTFYVSAVGSIVGALLSISSGVGNMNEAVLFFKHYTNLMNVSQPIDISSSPHPVPVLSSQIEFRNVSFRYKDEHQWILCNIDLNLPAGKCLALVGLNGAGKTTLVKLLTRLYDPTEGKILWDGIDYRDLDPQDLRNHIGVIFQDFVRFDLTARENIALGNVGKLTNGNDRTLEEAIYQASKKAGIHEAIEALPQGYQTTLSRWLAEDKQGVDLSGGEWQKIALARMFMRDNADLQILDEPTAALDAQAEYDIYDRFADLMRGKTSLLISHRFSTVRMADIIAVIEDGKISEYGSHEQLLSLGGTYARLYAMQADRYK